MRKIERLKKEALESCRFRGHRMYRFINRDTYWKSASAMCRDCGMFVYVDTCPLPNEIEIGGAAVALDCEKEE